MPESVRPRPGDARPSTAAAVHRLVPALTGTISPGSVIFLNGTTCSGKTSTAQALQALLPGTWIRMGVDDFNLKSREARGDRPPSTWDMRDRDAARPLLVVVTVACQRRRRPSRLVTSDHPSATR